MFYTSSWSAVIIIHASERGLVTVDPTDNTTRIALYHPQTIGIVPNLRDGGWAITMSHDNLLTAREYARHMCRLHNLQVAP
jgi:hypothetical protein